MFERLKDTQIHHQVAVDLPHLYHGAGAEHIENQLLGGARLRMFERLKDSPVRRVVGMMSGTSVDGVDAALVEISGGLDGSAPEVKLLAFSNTPFPPAGRCQRRRPPPAWRRRA